MNDVLTIAEIEGRYQDEWVLLEDPEFNNASEVLAGRVRCHSKDRDKVFRKAVELKPKRFALLYTGTIPEGEEMVL